MSFHGNPFKKKPAIETLDPVFGHLSFDGVIWSLIPKKTEDSFMITVAVPEGVPTSVQRDFFLKIRSKVPEFEERARDFTRSQVEGNVNVSSLTVYSVEIGTEEECRRESFVLEMSDVEAIVIHRVSFAGGEPVAYAFDD